MQTKCLWRFDPKRSTSLVTKLSITSKAFLHYSDRLLAQSIMYIHRTPHGHTRGLPNPPHNKPTEVASGLRKTPLSKPRLILTKIVWKGDEYNKAHYLSQNRKCYKTNLWENHFKDLIMIGSKVFLISFLKKIHSSVRE